MNATVKISDDHTVIAKYINFNDWFGEAWLLEIGIGYSSLFFVVEAECEEGVIDEMTDSDYGHLIEVSEDDLPEDEDYRTYAGNAGVAVNLDNVSMRRCDLVSCSFVVKS